jgi:hypothetical protein
VSEQLPGQSVVARPLNVPRTLSQTCPSGLPSGAKMPSFAGLASFQLAVDEPF